MRSDLRVITATLALFLIVGFALTEGTLVRAEAPLEAAEILRRAEEVRSPNLDFAVDFTLKVVNPDSAWKERTARYTMIAHGKDYSLVLMRQPPLFYPGTLLIMRHLYWLIFPKSTRPIQLSAQHILSGDISNGDLARGNLLLHYDVRLDGEETIDGKRCHRLELERTSNVVHYSRIRYWVEKRKLRPRKFEYYGRTGALLKTAWYDDYRNGPLGERSMRIEVEASARPGDKTTLTFSNIRPIDASQVSFTTEGLKAFRDAARDLFEVEGAQAQPEAILAAMGRSAS